MPNYNAAWGFGGILQVGKDKGAGGTPLAAWNPRKVAWKAQVAQKLCAMMMASEAHRRLGDKWNSRMARRSLIALLDERSRHPHMAQYNINLFVDALAKTIFTAMKEADNG